MLKKIITGVVGKGGVGKSTFSSNLALELAHFKKTNDISRPTLLIDTDAQYSYPTEQSDQDNYTTLLENSDSLENFMFPVIEAFNNIEYTDSIEGAYTSEARNNLSGLDLKILNLSNDLNDFLEIKTKIFELINNKLSQNTDIIINFPGDNSLELFYEYSSIINNLIFITSQEKSAHNTVAQMIINMYRELKEREIENPDLQQIHILYTKLKSKKHCFAADQFKPDPGKRWVNAALFKYYIQAFGIGLEEKMAMPFFIKGLEKLKKKPANNQITINPLYHIEEDPLLVRDRAINFPTVLRYFTESDEKKLPLSIRAIRKNAELLANNFKDNN